MDWGLCGTITALIVFIITQANDAKIKKLNDRVAKAEREYSALFNEIVTVKAGEADDNGSA